MDMKLLPVCLIEIQELQRLLREERHPFLVQRPGFLSVLLHHLDDVQGSLGVIIARYPKLSEKEMQRYKNGIRVKIDTGEGFLIVVINTLKRRTKGVKIIPHPVAQKTGSEWRCRVQKKRLR